MSEVGDILIALGLFTLIVGGSVFMLKTAFGEPLPADFFPQKIVEDYQTEYKGKIYYPMGLMVSPLAMIVIVIMVSALIAFIAYLGIQVIKIELQKR